MKKKTPEQEFKAKQSLVPIITLWAIWGAFIVIGLGLTIQH